MVACCGVSVVGTPSANSLTWWASRVPSSAVELPMMSLLNMPWTSVPAAFICWAMNSDPNVPCSSPHTAARTIVASGSRVAKTRASSNMAATPDPSSSAPGASSVKFRTSVTRESMCPVAT